MISLDYVVVLLIWKRVSDIIRPKHAFASGTEVAYKAANRQAKTKGKC